jgi:hypothetical protein
MRLRGTAPPTLSRSYGVPSVEDMAAALERFPRYDFDVTAFSLNALLYPK